MNLDLLYRPFPPESISWRVGATSKDKATGIALAYIDARDVMRRLDEVCGPANWQTRYPFSGCCEIGIKIDGEWVWKANGAGATDYEAEKGQYSDAFKRAGVLWGIAQYLYDLENWWMPIITRGNSYVFTSETIGELNGKLKAWAQNYFSVRIPPEEKKGVYEQMIHYLNEADGLAIKQIWGEYNQQQHVILWRMFHAHERSAIKEYLGE